MMLLLIFPASALRVDHKYGLALCAVTKMCAWSNNSNFQNCFIELCENITHTDNKLPQQESNKGHNKNNFSSPICPHYLLPRSFEPFSSKDCTSVCFVYTTPPEPARDLSERNRVGANDQDSYFSILSDSKLLLARLMAARDQSYTDISQKLSLVDRVCVALHWGRTVRSLASLLCRYALVCSALHWTVYTECSEGPLATLVHCSDSSS